MKTEMGEYLIGAYLKLKMNCNFVDYNVRRPGGGLAGLNELDVMGLDFTTKTAYLCEVTTHLDGVLYGSNKNNTIDRIKNKYDKMRDYAKNHLPKESFPNRRFMFWSPVVSAGVEIELEKIQGLELVINDRYSACVDELLEQAGKITYDTNNPAFRILQILGHLRR
ncbi:MAG: hypothetical protein PHI12_02485 [Dehalococcoidales bacterium]|nr:hypothetical protein [Dehalococcoidales bacterium]